MRKPILLLALAVLALLFSACGGNTGGGNGGGNTGGANPTRITLTVSNPDNQTVRAAYQLGSSAWYPLDLSGSTTKTATIELQG